jgi:LuxR family maltose regulon positive regulatory protein
MRSSLLSTKIAIPRLRADIIERTPLINRIKSGLGCPLTLISAPAGYGKTTLLAALVQQLDSTDLQAVWLSLDEGDNDPVRFWTHFISALQTKQPHVGNNVLKTLRSPENSDIQSCLAELINEIIADGKAFIQPCFLVLDDYHLIKEQTVHRDLTYILEHLPPQLRLVISTRADPPLLLARMRANGQLSEFRAQDLSFNLKETGTLLNSTIGLGLSDAEVTAVHARTEGWIASLQMAAISMQRQEDISGFIKAFTGTHRYILDYLTEEVLNHQTADTRAFLLETSILDRMTGSLCDAVTGRQDGQEMIERLDKANLFLISLDDERRWYRYHNLFSSVLVNRLRLLNPERETELRTRAAIWFRQNGLIEEAISQALAVKDFDLSSQLIGAAAPASLVLGEIGTLLNWLARLPEPTIRGHPDLCVVYAFALARVGRIDTAEAWLRRVEGIALRGVLKMLAMLTQAMIATSHQDDRRTIELLYQILGEEESLPDESESAEAVTILVAKLAAALILSEALVTHGQLRRAIETCQNGLCLVKDRKLEPPWSSMVGFLHMRLARILCEQNELERATQHILTAREISQRSGNREAQACAAVVLGMIRQAGGDEKGALDLVREAEQTGPRNDFSQHAISTLPWRMRISFARGDFVAAAELIRAYELALGPGRSGPLMALLQETVDTTLGHISLCEGDFSKAEISLAKVQDEAEKSGRVGNVIEILLLRALAARGAGNVAKAIDLLAKAVKLAEPEGYIRVFVDLGAPMAALLKEAIPRGINSSYIRKLLTEFERKQRPVNTTAYQPMVEPLTERELEVLRLLADGLSNEEIAKTLVLTVSTIKSHAHNIYAKLGVRTRTQAIKRAVSLNLL